MTTNKTNWNELEFYHYEHGHVTTNETRIEATCGGNTYWKRLHGRDVAYPIWRELVNELYATNSVASAYLTEEAWDASSNPNLDPIKYDLPEGSIDWAGYVA